MIYLLYWIGIFILSFALCTLIKVYRYDDEELPVSKDQLFHILKILLILGTIFLFSSLPFINYKLNKTKIHYPYEQLSD